MLDRIGLLRSPMNHPQSPNRIFRRPVGCHRRYPLGMKLRLEKSGFRRTE
jgi:hypothetical protein